MRKLAVMGQKGGTAKTTTTVNLAAALAALGKRVLVIDLDPQGNASSWLGATDEDAGKALAEVLVGERKLVDAVRPSSVVGVDLVPGSTHLAAAERALAGELGAEVVLRKALERLPSKWDIVIVDCPPALGLLSISACVACGELLVPIPPSTMALAGLRGLLQTLKRVQERLNPGLKLAGIVAVRVDARTRLSTDVVERLRERFGKRVFRTVIRENVKIAEAPSFAKSILDYAPTSTGAEDYTTLAKELLARDAARARRRSAK